MKTEEEIASIVYSQGFSAIEFNSETLLPGIVIVRPVRPPESLYGVSIPEAMRNLAGQFCPLHAVVACAKDVTRCKPGDVVKTREGMLDPLEASGERLSIDQKHIIDVLAVLS